MKIGILGSRGVPNHYGGYEQFAQYLSQAMVERGHEAYVYQSSLHPYKEQEWKGVQLVRCYDPEDKLGSFGQFVYDWLALRDARQRNFDVLLQLGYTSSAVWHRFWPQNTIQVLHMDGLEWKRSKYNGWVQRFLKWSEKVAAAKADQLIADSPAIQAYLQEVYQKGSAYIAYGAALPAGFGTQPLATYALEPGKYFLSIARFVPENNLEMIVEGYIDAGSDFPLVLIGNCENEHGKHLKKISVQKNVRFLGGIYNKTVLDNIRHFARYYFHGHSVGGTNPSLLEAMACASKILAHKNPFNEAVLADGAKYFSNKQEITNLLRQEMDEKVWNERIIANFDKLEKQFSWQYIFDEYERLFIRLINNKA